MRLRKNAKTTLIRSLPLFAGCSGREISQVAAIADEVTFRPGRVLATEGADGREFVVIVDGRATVEQDGNVIATLGAGDFFGEMALLTGRPRVASVVATGPVDALVIEERAFRRLLDEAPGIRDQVERALAERARSAA